MVLADEQDLDTSRRQLHQVEERLERAIADLAAKKKVETDLSVDLNLIDRQLRGMQRKADTARRRLAELDREVTSAQLKLERSRKEVETLRSQVQQRLTALYKSEEAGMLKAIFSARSLSQLFEDYDFFGRVVRHDRLLLDDFRDKVQQRQIALERMTATLKQQQEAATALKHQEEDLRRSHQVKTRFLKAVRKDRSALNSMIIALQEKAERLTALVDELSTDSPAKGTSTALFALQKGILPWPVRGPVKVSFGRTRHPDLGTLFDSQGIEIGAETDSAVKAVWNGKIAFAKSFKGYGNLIIVDHDGGYYTLYAQIDRLQKRVGDPVRQGEVIAYTGYDGSDHLYFEIRDGRTPIDPLPWIEKR